MCEIITYCHRKCQVFLQVTYDEFFRNKNKKKKRFWAGGVVQSIYLASLKPSVQILFPPKKKKKDF
jgi:hypothetical protein